MTKHGNVLPSTKYMRFGPKIILTVVVSPPSHNLCYIYMSLLASGTTNVLRSTNKCDSVPRSKLWNQLSPKGFYYNNAWNIRQCNVLDTHVTDFKRCLAGKTLILFGDSTTRNWYTELMELLRCRLTTEHWGDDWHWRKPSEAGIVAINFTMKWLPHAHPFFVGGVIWGEKKYMKSIPSYLDEIQSSENVIVTIHVYIHMLAFHHSVFENRIMIIRQSVERLLRRNPHAVVVIKGPHTFSQIQGSFSHDHERFADYFGLLHLDYIHREFAHLQDRVVLLDIRDMTIAKENSDKHPPREVVREMVKLLLTLACPS
jgi:hypothetical protein